MAVVERVEKTQLMQTEAVSIFFIRSS